MEHAACWFTAQEPASVFKDRCDSETCLGGSTPGAAHPQKGDQVTLHTGATFDDEHALVVPSQGLRATWPGRNPRATPQERMELFHM